MRAQRAAALKVPSPANPAAVLAPRILPAKSATTDGGTKKSNKPRKKTVLGSRSTPKRKNAEPRTVRVKGKPRVTTSNTMQPPAAANDSPQLVLVEKTSAATSDEGIALVAEVAPASPTAPMLVLAEEELGGIATLAGNEMSSNLASDEELCASNETNPPAEPTFSLLERPGFLEALSLQCAGLLRVLTQMWTWAQQKFKSHQVRKRLRVCETVSLGEKRFVAVIQVDGEQFLVGGSSSSVSTLAHLEPRPEFSDVLRTRCEGVGQA